METNRILFLTLIVSCLFSLAHGELYRDFEKRIYEDNKWKVDRSAASICYVVDGTLEEVKPGKPEYGYTCEMELKAYSANDKDAEDMCSSTFPHYILEAKPKDQNTRCKFVIINKCNDEYYLIYEKCYVVRGDPMPYAKAKELCEKTQGDKPEPKLAEYTSANLGVDLLHMEFLDVWMQVTERSQYFAGVEEEGGAVFVARNSWKYETKGGAIEMDDLSANHHPLCEYTPPPTVAGIHFRVGKYDVDGFPKFQATDMGFSFNTSQFCPANALDCHEGQAKGISVIFGAGDVGPGLKDIIVIPPAPKPCPMGWFSYERKNGRVICHQLFTATDDDSHEQKCQEHGAHLTGFDSDEELHAVMEHFEIKDKVNYWISVGAEAPCAFYSCNDVPRTIRTKYDVDSGTEKPIEYYSYQWANGMATNLDVLYDHVWRVQILPGSASKLVWTINDGNYAYSPFDFWIYQWSGYHNYMCGKYTDN